MKDAENHKSLFPNKLCRRIYRHSFPPNQNVLQGVPECSCNSYRAETPMHAQKAHAETRTAHCAGWRCVSADVPNNFPIAPFSVGAEPLQTANTCIGETNRIRQSFLRLRQAKKAAFL